MRSNHSSRSRRCGSVNCWIVTKGTAYCSHGHHAFRFGRENFPHTDGCAKFSAISTSPTSWPAVGNSYLDRLIRVNPHDIEAAVPAALIERDIATRAANRSSRWKAGQGQPDVPARDRFGRRRRRQGINRRGLPHTLGAHKSKSQAVRRTRSAPNKAGQWYVRLTIGWPRFAPDRRLIPFTGSWKAERKWSSGSNLTLGTRRLWPVPTRSGPSGLR
jgi:hypothetical protein